MRYLILLFALLVGSVSYAQPADYLISTNDCFLEFSEVRGSDTLVRFNLTLADLTYRNIGDDDIDISSGGDSDDLSIDIDRLPEFATVPLLVAYLDSVRALCTAPPTIGGLVPQVNIDTVIVNIDTAGTLIVDSVTFTGSFVSDTAVSPNDYRIDVPLGNIPSVYDFSTATTIHKFGENEDIDIGTTPEDVTFGGDFDLLVTADSIGFYSTDADDTNGGSGARLVAIEGVCTNYRELKDTVILSGTDTVYTDSLFRAVHRFKVLEAGATGWNEGRIVAENIATGQIFGSIEATDNQSVIAAFVVPEGKSMVLFNYSASLGRTSPSGANATFEVKVRDFNSGLYNVKFKFSISITAGTTIKEFNPGFLIPEKTVVKFTVSSISDSNTRAYATFNGVLIDNP